MESATTDHTPGMAEREYLNHAVAGAPQIESQALAATFATASLGNRVWHDIDRDGRQDPGEPGIAGVPVQLFAGDGAGLATTVTNVDGQYPLTVSNPAPTSSASSPPKHRSRARPTSVTTTPKATWTTTAPGPPNPPSVGPLPFTGADVFRAAVASFLSLVLGYVLFLIARRRRTDEAQRDRHCSPLLYQRGSTDPER